MLMLSLSWAATRLWDISKILTTFNDNLTSPSFIECDSSRFSLFFFTWATLWFDLFYSGFSHRPYDQSSSTTQWGASPSRMLLYLIALNVIGPFVPLRKQSESKQCVKIWLDLCWLCWQKLNILPINTLIKVYDSRKKKKKSNLVFLTLEGFSYK